MGREMISVEIYLPPVAYAQVTTGIYRGSHPSITSYPFLLNLKIKTLICVDGCDVKKELKEFCLDHEIVLIEKNVGHNQEPFVIMDEEILNDVINISLDPKCQPCLLFCANGKIITSTVVACLRKSLNWSFIAIIDEFEKFAGTEWDFHDLSFIEHFNPVLQSSNSLT